MRHAGIGWPENAGGEHPSVETILAMPGISEGCTLICSPSARYWYRQARGASPLVVWRAIPRQGELPAQLDWIGKRIADECLNLWDEQPHGGIEHFTPLNELQFLREAGEEFRSYAETASKLSNVRIALRQRFQALGHTVRLMFPAWVPQDDMDRLAEWEDEARQWDTIGLHCYGDAETMQARYLSYRSAFPNHPIFVGEWNSNHEGHDERASLEMWRDVADADPLFLGAAYYIWETHNSGERDLSIWGNPDRLALFANPPGARIPAPEEPMPTTDYEAFCRAEARRRGITPDVAVIVANSEGGLTEPARRGTFATGSSWWAFQLHYGGPGYEHLGTVAGMGNSFSALTGWQPGDPRAWQDAMRYALDAARAGGWGPWYGAKAKGVTGFYGVDRGVPWSGTPADEWDYRRGTMLPFNSDASIDRQPDGWSCSIQAAQWLLRTIGRNPDASDPHGDPWLRQQLVPGIVDPAVGLRDGSGAPLAAWITREYGTEMGFVAQASPVTFDDVAAGAGVNPTLIGGAGWNHWVGVRRVNPDGTLALANPSPGYKGVGDSLSRDQWARLGPFHAIWIDRMSTLPAPAPPAPPVRTPAIVLAEIEERLAELKGMIV